MKESVIIQKLIQVGQMLERGELEYSGAEADTKYYLEQYAVLSQQPVVWRSEEFKCGKCNSNWGKIRATCFECGHESEDLST